MASHIQNRPRHFHILFIIVLILSAVVISAGNTRGQTPDDLRGTFSYISPLPDAELVSAGTTIAVRGGQTTGKELFEELYFTVSGTHSGRHLGEKILAEDGETVLFRPDIPFYAAEKVFVTIDTGQESYSYSFQVAAPISSAISGADQTEYEDVLGRQKSEPDKQDPDAPVPFRTAPKDLPRFEVTSSGGATGDGYVFISPFNYVAVGSTPAYLLILDNNAEPVYYHRFSGLPNAMDFKKNPNGLLTYHHRGKGEFIALNNRYEEVDSYAAGNGLRTNLHDIQLLDNGHRLHLNYDRQIMDMSVIVPGGHPTALVTGCIVQELDAGDNVVFEWRSWDYIDILDTVVDVTAKQVNYMNCNSIERDSDGHLLLSSRNLDEITKINRQTGELIWRMGGKKNEFTFTNDDGFSRQHDARRLYNGHITLYDNGVTHSPQFSRGLELEVDELNKTVTVVREFRNTPDTFGVALGNMQRLPGGNSVVGWGRSSKPVFTEFNFLGTKLLEFSALKGVGSYRAFRFPWQGYPSWPPALIAYADGQDVELFFSWNGSTETSGYMIYASAEGGDQWHVATVAKDGFENSYNFAVPSNGIWDFWVVPVEPNLPIESSNVVRLLIGGQSVYLPMVSMEGGTQN